MGKSSTLKYKASNVSSSSKPASHPNTRNVSTSSILKSSFAPSRFQLSLFVSVIRGFDSEHLRIHDIHTGRLKCDHAVGEGASVTCLDWGYYSQDPKNTLPDEGTRKRKRTSGDTSNALGEGATLAFGTSKSEVHFFSPTEGKIKGTLSEGHEHGIKDFKFVSDGVQGQGWSIGGDSKLVQWDLKRNLPIRSLSPSLGPLSALQPSTSLIICASHLVYLLDPQSEIEPLTFNASTNPVRLIVVPSEQDSKVRKFITASENDRTLNVFEADSRSLSGSLLTESEVLHAELSRTAVEGPISVSRRQSADSLIQPREILAIVNQDGAIELFPEPFNFVLDPKQSEINNMKARMKQRTRRSTTQIRLCKAAVNRLSVSIINVSLQGAYMKVAWAEGGVNVVFDTVKWLDEVDGEMILHGNADILTQKGKLELGSHLTNGVKEMNRTHLDESQTVVTNGLEDNALTKECHPEVINISSGEEESGSSDEGEQSILQQNTSANSAPDINGRSDGDVDMKVIHNNSPAADHQNHPPEVEGPSFGDLLRATAPDPVDVAVTYSDPNQQSLVTVADQSLQQLPSGVSLGTVLTQSLRTNDKNLLQTCFQVKDLSIVRATIQRLDSSFAPALLQRLAERLHSRPGRAGSLMVWIQWTLIAHGGYLAARPNVMNDLSALQHVVKERANSLQSLLSLKGKLDMLEAQMNMRKIMSTRAQGPSEEDEEAAVVYVEGQEGSDSELGGDGDAASSESEDDSPQARAGAQARKAANLEGAVSEDVDADPAADMPMANGNLLESDGEGSNSDEEGMFDGEASSTDRDSGHDLLEEEVNYDDVDTGSSDGETSPSAEKLPNLIRTAQSR